MTRFFSHLCLAADGDGYPRTVRRGTARADRPGSRRGLGRAFAVPLALLLVAAGLLAAVALRKELSSHDVRGSSTVEFVTTEARSRRPRRRPAAGVVWPTFGYDPARTPRRALLAASRRCGALWTFRGRQLLEFPPVDRLRPSVLREQQRRPVRRQRHDRPARVEARVGPLRRGVARRDG